MRSPEDISNELRRRTFLKSLDTRDPLAEFLYVIMDDVSAERWPSG